MVASPATGKLAVFVLEGEKLKGAFPVRVFEKVLRMAVLKDTSALAIMDKVWLTDTMLFAEKDKDADV